ncbi:MAG: RluA family pseudouridine synthase [SAR324 cluster bacterium]|nr:RluA family pseudouridine synthase [SAR324 cluster bacterium]
MIKTSIQKLIYYKQKTEEKTIIDFLVDRFPYLSRSKWADLIDIGKIKINQQKVNQEYQLIHLDSISYERQKSDEPPIEKDYNIIWQDDNFLVVEKGGKLPVSISGRYYQNTLIEILKDENNYPILFPVHRIDKETSGLVMFAKTSIAAAKLGKIFAAAEHQKYYHTILNGQLDQPKVVVDMPITKNDGRSLIHIRQICDSNGKSAQSVFENIACEDNLTFAKVTTHRGRTHQIRCHAELIKAPVLGDKLYGKNDQDFLDYLKNDTLYQTKSGHIIKRQLLHASMLEFINPFNQEILKFHSNPLPFFEKTINLAKLFPLQLKMITKNINSLKE